MKVATDRRAASYRHGMFDASINDAIMSCSDALAEGQPLPRASLILGFRPLQWSRDGQLDRALGALGLQREGSLWGGGEGPSRYAYEHRLDGAPSALGYLTLGELDAWARELCHRAASRQVAIELPPLVRLMNADSAGVRLLVDGLLETAAGLAVRFSSHGDARADAALGVAIGLFTEGAQLRLLAETMKHQRTLDARSIQALLSLSSDRAVHADALRVINVRLRRTCASLEEALHALASA